MAVFIGKPWLEEVQVEVGVAKGRNMAPPQQLTPTSPPNDGENITTPKQIPAR